MTHPAVPWGLALALSSGWLWSEELNVGAGGQDGTLVFLAVPRHAGTLPCLQGCTPSGRLACGRHEEPSA